MKNGNKVKVIENGTAPEDTIGLIGIVKSTDYGNPPIGVYFEEIDDSWYYEESNLQLIQDKHIIKKSDLKGGDIVTYRNGAVRVIDINRKRIVYLENFNDLSMCFNDYNEDLFNDDNCNTNWDIVEVYRPTTKETFKTERKKEIKKMTVAQICEELGYDIEIIKEDK